MKQILPVLTLAFLFILILNLPLFAQENTSEDADLSLDTGMSLSEIGEVLGVRGGDLAVLLGLDRGIDKGTPLSELGVTADQLNDLIESGAYLDEPVEPEGEREGVQVEVPVEHDAADISMTTHELAAMYGMRGGDFADLIGVSRSESKDIPISEFGIDQATLDEIILNEGLEMSAAADINLDMTISEIAKILGVTDSAVAKDIHLDIEVDKNIPVSQLGIDQETLNEAVEHIIEDEHDGLHDWKYLFFGLIVLFATGWLLWWGIPKGADPKKTKNWYPERVYLIVLALTVAVNGFWIGKSPNPMEGTVKVFKSIVGLYESVGPHVVVFIFFLILALIANKAICGWACPFGALEELIYTLPFFKKAKKLKIPFWITNSIRSLIFVLFILMLYGIIGRKGYVIYHEMNPFNMFNIEHATQTMMILIAVYLLTSFIIYRPFCRFICPFGLMSWMVEKFSITQVRIDFDKCIDCRACDKACPHTAAGDRLDKKALPADCFTCMRCLRTCPVDAIHWRPIWGSASKPSEEKKQM